MLRCALLNDVCLGGDGYGCKPSTAAWRRKRTRELIVKSAVAEDQVSADILSEAIASEQNAIGSSPSEVRLQPSFETPARGGPSG